MKLFLVTVLLISMVAGTWAINCYSCSGAACNDPFVSSGSGVRNVNCPNIPGFQTPQCSKTVGRSQVGRSCAAPCVAGCQGGYCTSCCNTNLCNGGNTVTTSFVAMGVAMLAAFILARQ